MLKGAGAGLAPYQSGRLVGSAHTGLIVVIIHLLSVACGVYELCFDFGGAKAIFGVVKAIPALLAAIFISISSIHAEIIFGNLGSSGRGGLDTASQQITSTTWLAQGFTTPVSGGLLNLESIVLGLSVNSGFTDTRVQLFANSGGLPSGSALATVLGSVASNTPALYTFTLASPYLLSSGTTYWIVVSDPDVGDQYNWVFNEDQINPSGQNSSGYLWPSAGTLRTINGGANWSDRSAFTQSDAAFYLNASAAPVIPEPGTWAAAALLAGGAAFARWRKRKSA